MTCGQKRNGVFDIRSEEAVFGVVGHPLAQQVAREHRGSLAYRSRPGHTVFTLLLPIHYEPHGEQESVDG